MEINKSTQTYRVDVNNQQNQYNSHYLYKNTPDTVELSSAKKADNKNNGFISGLKSFGKSVCKNFNNDENTHYFSAYKGFEEHFFKKDQGLVHNIDLTKKQQKTLQKRISEFENYRNSLSPKEQAALEKNKHSLLDFCIVDGMPDNSFSGYKKFLSKYENFKSGDFSGMTNEDLAQLLFYTNTADIVSDKKIGIFAQGRVGDCWFLSQLGNYASTPEGEKNIADRIKGPDKDGNYTVIFDNPVDKSIKEEYLVKADELKNYDLSDLESVYSSGDLDVRILEIATTKMLQKYFIEQNPVYCNSDLDAAINRVLDDNLFHHFDILNEGEPLSGILAEGFSEKELLVHRALGYDSNIKTYAAGDSEIMKNYIERLDMPKPDSIYEIETSVVMENGSLKFSYNINPTQYKNLSDVVLNPDIAASELICTSSNKSPEDEVESRYISTGHVYNIMKKTEEDGTIVVNDPYNSAFPHAIDSDMINNRMRYVMYFQR